jgi:hypothetical protein
VSPPNKAPANNYPTLKIKIKKNKNSHGKSPFFDNILKPSLGVRVRV